MLLARQAGRRAPVNEALAVRAQRAVGDKTAAGSLPDEDLLQLLAGATVLVDVERLRAELTGTQPPAVLDVRWALGDSQGKSRYLSGHLPGSVYVDLDTELAAPPSVAEGRHPLPDPEALQRSARRWGLRSGQSVVVYDTNGGQSAARAWWLLRWAGAGDVRLLDGGLDAWVAAGGGLVTDDYQPPPGDVELTSGHLPVLDVTEAADLPAHGVLVDARAAERYAGRVEPIDSRAGHVPGAISLPTAENIDSGGHFLTAAQLRRRFDHAGLAGEVGVYCGSGVTAAHEIAALQIAGIDAALYPGSWSAWSADPARPVVTGTNPH